jgi:hypothetical protein
MEKPAKDDNDKSSFPSTSDGNISPNANEDDDLFMSQAVQMTSDTLDQAYEQKGENQSSNHAEATNLSIESIATLYPNANEELVTQFIRGQNRIHFVEADWPKEKDDTNSCPSSHSLKNEEQRNEERGCSQCQRAEFEVSVNVASVLFDLFNVPFATARKGATALINAMPWDAKVQLANIAEEYFTDPGNIVKIAKGINIISEMIIATFGDIGTVISIAFHDLSRKDYAIITANIAISVSLLFASGGTALVIRLGLKTKTIYGIVSSVLQLKKERNRHSKKRKNGGGETAVAEEPVRRSFVRLKDALKDRVVSVLEESNIFISKNDSPKNNVVSNQSKEEGHAQDQPRKKGDI